MSTRDLIDAIQSGDSVAVQSAFEASMAERVAARLDTMRQVVAQNMFKESCNSKKMKEESDEGEEEGGVCEEAIEEAAGKVGDNHLHVQEVKHEGKTKYKVHAVGKNFADGIKVGEHLSDSELDDFQDMGGKVKHVK